MAQYTGSGRNKEGGFSATHKADFNFHVKGEGFLHNASDIQMNPPLGDVGGPFYDKTVQGSMEKLFSFSEQSLTGLVSIGIKGQNQADFLVGSDETPTTEDAFNAAFASVQLTRGGLILIKNGHYKVETTIEIPPGISLTGEHAGTIIYSETNEQSIFKILEQSNRLILGGNPEIEQVIGATTDYCSISNLILSDNLFGNVQEDDLSIATMTTVPMIEMEEGTNFSCQNISFIGRINQTVIDSSGRPKTYCAISCVSSGSLGTNLVLENCYFDGLQIAINYLPNNSNLDYLTIKNCKARTFGDESTDKPYISNCFVIFTPCNAQFLNNYHLAGSETVNACFVLYNDISLDQVKISIIGTSGGPSPGLDAEKNLFVNADNTNYSLGTISGNSWGYCYQNEWFITIGSGEIGQPLGDFNGANALNSLLSLSENSNLFPTTIILNCGTHLLTGTTKIGKFKIKGNKIGKNYPIIETNLSDDASDDLIINKYITLGSSIESIYFKNIATNFNSIHLTTNSAGNVYVNDCIFNNINLYVEPIISPLEYPEGLSSITTIEIDKCNFFQDFDNDNISVILPSAHNTKISNSHFSGGGYALAIGEISDISFNSNTPNEFRNVYLENVTFDLTGYEISGYSKISENLSYYIFITDPNANIFMNNVKIYADSSLADVSNFTLLDAHPAATRKFTYFYGKNITIENSIFNGPIQTFTSAAIDYPIPTIFANPKQSLYINNSKFLGGLLPLQISGSNVFSANSSLLHGITISNSEFISLESGSQRFTLLDIDSELNVDITELQLLTIIPKINIFNNLFSQKATDTSVKPLHLVNTTGSGNYFSQAIVQIYSGLSDIQFINNKVYGTLTVNDQNDGYYFGIYINNYDQGIHSSISGIITNPVIFNNNTIEIVNEYESSSTNDLVCSVGCKSNIILMNNNYISMINTGVSITPPTCNFAGCLYLNNTPSNTNLYSETIITNNIFSRRRITGGSLELKRGFIYIDSNTGPGKIIDNNFSDYTTDGSDTELLLNNSSSYWIYEKNKNQTKTTEIRGDSGIFQINDKLHVDPTLDSYIKINQISSPGYSIEFIYANSEPFNVIYSISLYNILPKNVYIIEASCISEVFALFNTCTLTFALTSNNTSPTTIDNSVNFSVITGPSTIALSPGNTNNDDTFYINDTSNTYLSLNFNASDSSSNSLNVTPILITYRW